MAIVLMEIMLPSENFNSTQAVFMLNTPDKIFISVLLSDFWCVSLPDHCTFGSDLCVSKDPQTAEYFIPEYSRPPYTKARAKTTTAIYNSIVSACIKRRSVCAKLYHISNDEFQKYISDLSENGYIDIKIHDNVPCYYANLKSQEFVSSKSPMELLQSCIAVASEAAAKGATSAAFEKILI